MTLAVVVFWVSALWVVHVYVGYPVLLALLAPLGRSVRRDDGHQPRVSILIAAYNEAAVIEATLRNKLAQDWPSDRLEILVVSDASDDGTDTVVERLAGESPVPIRLVRQTPRQGKTAGLNRLVPQATGDVLCFSDANSEWAPDALGHLARNFADPTVGYVTGKMVYTSPDGSLVGDGCSAYMRYENVLRALETRVGSVVGVDGGIDAMRRKLYRPMRPDQLPDFVQPLRVVEQGYRVVYEPRALLREPALAEAEDELRMRVRVTLRALWALQDMRHLFDPIRRPVFAFQLASHKLLRYLAFVPLALLLLTSAVLVPHPFFTLAFVGQLAFHGLALFGRRLGGDLAESPLVGLPYYFGLINWACVVAFGAWLRGERKVVWNPRGG